MLGEKPKDFEAFLAAMREAGYEAKLGKYLAFFGPGQKKFIRCDTLKGDHTTKAIRERIEGKREYVPTQKPRRSVQPQQKTPSRNTNTSAPNHPADARSISGRKAAQTVGLAPPILGSVVHPSKQKRAVCTRQPCLPN